MSCLITESLDVPEETNFPPSIVSPADAEFSLNAIVLVDRTVMSGELVLDVEVRDPNVEQTLFLLTYVDFARNSVAGFVEQANDNSIPPTGDVVRPLRIRIPIDRIGDAGSCHQVELRVSSRFGRGQQFRDPELDGDIDTAVWWVNLVDESNRPELTLLGSCPQ